MGRLLRTIVFGGAFDPPHDGHLALARHARDSIVDSSVLLTPVYQPCHKPSLGASFEDRCTMIELLVTGERGLFLSPIEAELEGTSFTWKTLDALARGPCVGHELFFLMGADSLEDFPFWRSWKRILHLARILVAPRQGHDVSPPEPLIPWWHRFVVLHGFRHFCSSSSLRRNMAVGQTTNGTIPAPVARFIEQRGLYGVAPGPPQGVS